MGTNPFSAVAEFWSPLAMEIYIVLMIIAVVAGRCSTRRTRAAAVLQRARRALVRSVRNARSPPAHVGRCFLNRRAKQSRELGTTGQGCCRKLSRSGCIMKPASGGNGIIEEHQRRSLKRPMKICGIRAL